MIRMIGVILVVSSLTWGIPTLLIEIGEIEVRAATPGTLMVWDDQAERLREPLNTVEAVDCEDRIATVGQAWDCQIVGQSPALKPTMYDYRRILMLILPSVIGLMVGYTLIREWEL